MRLVTPERWYVLFWLSVGLACLVVQALTIRWVLDQFFERR